MCNSLICDVFVVCKIVRFSLLLKLKEERHRVDQEGVKGGKHAYAAWEVVASCAMPHMSLPISTRM